VINPVEYSDKLQKKILELQELVDTNITELAARQQSSYHSGTAAMLVEGQKVFVNNPTHQKLDAQWTGPWIVLKTIDATSVKVKMGTREQVVHINRIFPLLQEDTSTNESQRWTPPIFTHTEPSGDDEVASDNSGVTTDDPPLTTTRSGRVVRPVDYYED